VIVAPDGQAGLELFLGRFSNVDLVVTDLMMPNMSGREMAERIHQVRPDLPILYMSGHSNDDVVRREILSSRAIFLQKPFRPEALFAKVREASLTRPL
jgi:CheY-like chemotaxis protein